MTNKLTSAILAISLLLSFTTYGQQDSTKKRTYNPNLQNLKDVINSANFDRTSWSLYGNYNETKYAPTKAENVMQDIDQFLSKNKTTDERNGEVAEFNLVKKYRNNIDSTFQQLQLFGTDQLGQFFYLKPSSIPIRFALYGDTALTMLISGIYIDNVYNTLKLTSRQRATKVITSYLLPQLKVFAKSFSNKEIKYFGFAAVYGSKDFASNSALATKAEFVSFVAPSSIIKKYATGDLTEDELVNSADVYVSDRDMVVDVKKIKITLE